MRVKPITSDTEHNQAMTEAKSLMEYNPAPESPLGQYLKILVEGIEAYEKKRWPIEKPTPEEAAAFRAA